MLRHDTTLDAREVVAAFETAEMLQGAIDELLVSGFDRADLSLLASEATAQMKLSHRKPKAHEIGDDPATPRQPYVSTEDRGDFMGALIGAPMYVGGFLAVGAIVASGGTLAAVIMGAAAAGGAGMLIGSALAKRYGDTHARQIQEHLDQGGLLLWVRAKDQEREDRAMSILKKHAGTSVHVIH